jgi:hypothetical protein
MILMIIAIAAILITILYNCFWFKKNHSYKELIKQIEQEKNYLNAIEEQQKDRQQWLKELQADVDKYKTDLSNLLDSIESNKVKQVALEENLKNIQNKVDNTTKLYEDEKESNNAQIQVYRDILDQEKERIKAANELRQREEKENAAINDQRICVDEEYLDDIEKLYNLAKTFSHPDIIYKLVWKEFYQKPLNSLISRLLGDRKVCGIYKITHIATGKAYIGKSVNIADRWKSHVKNALGATKSAAQFHLEMRQLGVHNFTFDVIEECDEKNLSEEEAYWINFYGTKTYGFNSINGSSN